MNGWAAKGAVIEIIAIETIAITVRQMSVHCIQVILWLNKCFASLRTSFEFHKRFFENSQCSESIERIEIMAKQSIIRCKPIQIDANHAFRLILA